ncbi:MAG: long-chain fatty acid--CoA ligase, partial [Nitrospirota bacterium]
VSTAVVHGDRRKYCVALVTLDPDAVAKWAEAKGLPNDPTAISKHAEMVELIEAAVAEANRNLASYETIKRVAILPDEFSVEAGELTPSLKMKRRTVERHYAAVLDSMYETDGDPAP